jgi:hypothetical protein
MTDPIETAARAFYIANADQHLSCDGPLLQRRCATHLREHFAELSQSEADIYASLIGLEFAPPPAADIALRD